jgi:hypothetical protein
MLPLRCIEHGELDRVAMRVVDGDNLHLRHACLHLTPMLKRTDANADEVTHDG